MSEYSPEPPVGFAAGSRIAGYRLLEQIGQGGMAVVFRAHDERLDRQVALKILAPALAADTAFRQRFIRESRAAAAVDDPHIIPVYEAGEASGVLFIAMRLVRGGDVRSLLRQAEPLPPARIAAIVSQVATALDAAHERGLVHRDVKPANMLLGGTPSAGRPDHVYLTDFGLSKGSLEVSGITGTGTFLGTLDYIAPEQIAGRPVDGRADQYALACTAFELLTGRPPFARDEATAVMYAQLSEPPPSVAFSRPDLPGAIDAVFARALAKSPGNRYGSCQQFADALRQALEPPAYHSGSGAVRPQGRPPTELAAQIGGPGRTALPDPDDGTEAWPGPGRTTDPRYAAASDPGGFAGASRPPGAAGTDRSPAGPGLPPGAAVIPPAGPTMPSAGSAMPSAGSAMPPAGSAVPPMRSPVPPRSTTPGLTEQASGPADWSGAPSGPGHAAARGGRSRWSAALAAGVILLIAAGAGAAFLSLHHHAAHAASHPGARRNESGHSVRTVALTPPQCGASIGTARSVRITPAGMVSLRTPPYGAIVTADLGYTFVALPRAIEVLRNSAGIPVGPPIRTIPIPDHAHAQALTSNGEYLVTATDHGATVIRVSAAERPGSPSVVVGRLVSGLPGNPGGDDLALSTDDSFVFVAMRYADKIAVFDLAKALRAGFGSADLVGYIPVGIKPHGMVASPDGRWLYVANRFARQGTLEGTISVVSVRVAERHPARSVISSAVAGCGAYRVIESPDGSVLWVIAQSSDYLVGFSASKLRTDPSHALIAEVPIGATPLDEALIKGGTRIVVTDNSGSNLAVVDPAAALAGSKHALVGYLETTELPRFFATEVDGPVVLLVTGGSSDQVQAIRTDDIP